MPPRNSFSNYQFHFTILHIGIGSNFYIVTKLI